MGNELGDPGLPATLGDVRAWLASLGTRVGATFVGDESKGKPSHDNVACLVHRSDGSWLVGYFERGSYDDARVFGAEAQACADFVQMVRPTSRRSEATSAWHRYRDGS